MQGRNQRGKLNLLYILDLIDEEDHTAFGRLGGIADSRKQVLEIDLQFSVVRQSRFGIQLPAHGDVLIRDPDGCYRSGKSPQGAMRQDSRREPSELVRISRISRPDVCHERT